ncbi:MAG: metallophosphoesterase [Nannocystis sp.]|nr:metallophosphoesterase [Nannocystis sp.]
MAAAPDLLLISDLHLGSHLKPRMRGEYVHLAARIDELLPRFLEHYQGDRRGDRRWLLVINGDFIDFWNIEEGRDPALVGEPLAIARLHAALDAYPGVEDAFVRFLEAGDSIVFVAGNHDAELLYGGVRRALRERIEAAMAARPAASVSAATARLRDVAPGRVHFVPWFLHEPGAMWIEHGHLFDPACATPNQLAPTRRGHLVQTLAEVATRSFTNLTPEIDYDAPDRYGAIDYIRWAAARGLRFVLLVVFLYLRMVGRMLALWAGRGRVDRAGKAAHQELLERVAQNAGMQMSTLTALQAMAPPPSSATVGGVLSVTALDLILTGVSVASIVLGIGAALEISWWVSAPAGAIAGIALARAALQRRSKRAIADAMSEVAAAVGAVTGVPLVLMGHSHRGSIEAREGVIYGNSGCWLDGSHLVVRRGDDGRPEAIELRRWRNGGVVIVQERAL